MMTEEQKKLLDGLYQNRKAFHGELHDHSNSGGRSDGKFTLTQWREGLAALDMDFAAILDHRQVRHMYLPEWEDGLFISGTEPGTAITDSKAEKPNVHYNMLVPYAACLETVLKAFPEYGFAGGHEDFFEYPRFTTERFRELIAAVKAQGGLFVHPHPKQLMVSEDPTDYWFSDGTGIEVFYESIDSQSTKDDYQLWTDLLKCGKRIWACAGGDGHAEPSDQALTTLYAEEHTNASYLKHLSIGDFVCGPVGIRMAMGETLMGGSCDFNGKTLLFSVGDFHRSVKNVNSHYRVDVLTDTGVIFSEAITTDTSYFALRVNPESQFVRVEVFDETKNLRIAVGNPIWNDAE